jgi:hypothetical protein
LGNGNAALAVRASHNLTAKAVCCCECPLARWAEELEHYVIPTSFTALDLGRISTFDISIVSKRYEFDYSLNQISRVLSRAINFAQNVECRDPTSTDLTGPFALALPQARDVAVLNEKVYTELFLTPKSDPWLGLKPSDAYSALDHDGVVTAATP